MYTGQNFVYVGPQDSWKRILPVITLSSFGFLEFRGLLGSLMLLGPYFPKLRQLRGLSIKQPMLIICELSKYWNMFPLLLLHLYGVHHLFRCYARFGGDDFWTTSVDFIRAGASIITSDLLIIKQRDLHQVLRRSLTYPGAPHKRPSGRYMAICLTILCWMYMSVWLSFGCFKLTEFSYLATWADTQWYGTNLTEFSMPMYVAATTDLAFQRILLNGPSILSISLYVCQCRAVRGRFKVFNESMKSMISHPYDVTSGVIRKWRILRCDLVDLVGDMDGVFAPLAFLWTGMFVVGFCAELTRFLEHMRMESDLKNTIFFIMDFGFLALWFYMISMIGSSISEEAEESLAVFHELLSKTTSTEPYFHQEAKFLDGQLSAPTVALTGWNFFEINRGVVTTVIGALLTYIVVIIEMDPGAKQTIKGETE